MVFRTLWSFIGLLACAGQQPPSDSTLTRDMGQQRTQVPDRPALGMIGRPNKKAVDKVQIVQPITGVSLDSLFIQVGDTAGVACKVTNQAGAVLAKSCAWVVLVTTRATVSPASGATASVRGVGDGITRVIASTTGKADTTWVIVSTGSPVPPPPPPPPPPPDTTACAATLRTVNVSTTAQLDAAMVAALPGDCVVLAAGTYAYGVNVNQNKGGTAANPVVFNGAGRALTIISGNSGNAWQFVTGANYITFKNLRWTNWFYGPIANPSPYTTTGGNFLVFDNVEVDHNARQGIAFYNGASNGIIRNSYIHHMGLALAGTCGPGQFGEGVYVGGQGAGTTDWQILNNTFDNVTAEAVDISPGSDRTIVTGNAIDGSASVYFANCTTSLIASYGNNVVISNNTLVKGNPHGIVLYGGAGVTVRGNQIDLQNIHAFTGSVGVHASAAITPVVGCDNVVTNIPVGGSAYDVQCQ